MADVEEWPEPDLAPAATETLAGAMTRLMPRLRRVLAASSELGERAAPATIELDDDPVLASYQAVAVAPIGPADQQPAARGPGRDPTGSTSSSGC